MGVLVIANVKLDVQNKNSRRQKSNGSVILETCSFLLCFRYSLYKSSCKYIHMKVTNLITDLSLDVDCCNAVF